MKKKGAHKLLGDRFKLGIMTESLHLPLKEALRMAEHLGAQGVQLNGASGEVSPQMGGGERRELRSFLQTLGLEISALCGDLGGHGFTRATQNAKKISDTKKIIDLAVDLGTAVVTTHVGVIPADPKSDGFAILSEACGQMASYAKERGVTLAIETGPETAKVLASFLNHVGSPGLGVNLDPANLVMVTGDDPVKAVGTLSKYIVHTHAKDGVKLAPCDAQAVYDAFAEKGLSGFDFGKYFNETPLGEGKVPWKPYLEALSQSGYCGYLTVEREVGATPQDDIARALDFLREQT